jgi:hypothetical protein
VAELLLEAGRGAPLQGRAAAAGTGRRLRRPGWARCRYKGEEGEAAAVGAGGRARRRRERDLTERAAGSGGGFSGTAAAGSLPASFSFPRDFP